MIVLFMDYCRSKQLRKKTMASYEQTLKLFVRWLKERYGIENAEEVQETHIHAYIVDLQSRGKYTFCADERSQVKNHPQNRRDYRQKISNITINNYLRNLRVFFTWLVDSDCLMKTPMRKVRELPQERPPREYLENDEVLCLLKNLDVVSLVRWRGFTTKRIE
jgi:integrase/recombinase XerD